MNANPHIVFAGGGTAGRLHPGLAVASQIKQRMPEVDITFAGMGKALERHAVRAAGFNYSMVPCQGSPQTPMAAVRFVTDNVAGYWAARWMLKEQQVSLVVGLGGYTCAAMVRASISRGIPTVLLEQNAVPSRTTRWFAGSVDMVCTGFEQIREHLPEHTTLTLTGNPVRNSFVKLAAKKKQKIQQLSEQHAVGSSALRMGYQPQSPSVTQATAPVPAITHPQHRLVIIGGAGGSQTLNHSIPKALAQMGNRIDGWRIVHQAGEGQLQATEDQYRKCGVDGLVVSFIDEMAAVLFETDLVVCQAGGSQLAELNLSGVPAILVPATQPQDAHELVNARIMQEAGAATLVDESKVSGDIETTLSRELDLLMNDSNRRLSMAQCTNKLARPDAAHQIADAVCRSLRGETSRLVAA